MRQERWAQETMKHFKIKIKIEHSGSNGLLYRRQGREASLGNAVGHWLIIIGSKVVTVGDTMGSDTSGMFDWFYFF